MADVSAPPSPKKGDGTSPSSMNLAAGDVMDADGESPVRVHYTTCLDLITWSILTDKFHLASLRCRPPCADLFPALFLLLPFMEHGLATTGPT